METLDQRRLLAPDLFVGPLPPIDAQAAISPSKPAALASVLVGTIVPKTPSGEGEAAARIGSTSASHYDLNGDGIVSPIDVLLVINASAELRAGRAISEETFAAFDVNRDGVLPTDDIDLLVEQTDAQGPERKR